MKHTKTKIEEFKSSILRVLFPNEHGGTNYYAYKHRACMFVSQIKRWLKLSKVFLKFWHIPFDMERLTLAAHYADKELDDCFESIHSKDETIKNLTNELASEYIWFKKMSEEEAYREAYQSTYGEEEWQSYIPSKYLTKREADDKFDRDLDAFVTRDPIGDSTYYDLMRYELNSVKRGMHEIQ
jgi:hypothetical protein